MGVNVEMYLIFIYLSYKTTIKNLSSILALMSNWIGAVFYVILKMERTLLEIICQLNYSEFTRTLSKGPKY
jgi:hypothetical protein